MNHPELAVKNNFSKEELLGAMLRDVSRSFYLTLRALPAAVRTQISLAYLLARAADTIADTEVLAAPVRLERLLQFRRLLAAPSEAAARDFSASLEMPVDANATPVLAAEQRLLRRLPESLALLGALEERDRALVVEVVTQLSMGMELDLQRFPSPSVLGALDTLEELEDYTWHVAGCVGPFWTKMCVAHLAAFRGWEVERMSGLGVRFGKALQWTNILRDLPRDLRNGRCYLPRVELQKIGLTPEDLRDPAVWPRLAPFYHQCLDHALAHYGAAEEYLRQIPRRAVRVRLACVWPQWIGLETLALLRRAANPLAPEPRLRVTRPRVRAILLRSAVTAWSDRLLFAHHARLTAAVRWGVNF